jgi:branched-chain amino acid transport system ATP-binding protein
MSARLEVKDVSVSFGGVHALSDISIAFPPGTIIGIIGPNGAGKTTLLNAICGLFEIDTGDILLDGKSLVGLKPNLIAARGLRRTFQASQLFPGMSVLENMMTGMHLMGTSGLVSCALRTNRMRQEESVMRARHGGARLRGVCAIR